MTTTPGPTTPPSSIGWIDARDYGFSPDADGIANAEALQRALDRGGTIIVSQPGTYDMARTVYVGSHTSLTFGAGVWMRKTTQVGPFSHVLLNRGAMSKTCDEAIAIHGLRLIINEVDFCTHEVFGLRGQLAFFHVHDLTVTGFRCYDLGRMQYAIHICSFEDIRLDDLIIHGKKDGVHLGRGKRFTISNGVFRTLDDAIALNAHDYDTGNPELGWIEHGVIENCHDLYDANTKGYFCRILAGAWRDWEAGMEVQKSDTVVSNGRLYRVRAEPDGTKYRSLTQPLHERGAQMLDGINWHMLQDHAVYNAGVRHVVFRDITLASPRTAFSIHFDKDRYSRSYYPGAVLPQQEDLLLDHVTVVHDQPLPLLSINTPVDAVTISHSRLADNRIQFRGEPEMHGGLPTQINLIGCTFIQPGETVLLQNDVVGKRVTLRAVGSLPRDGFAARIVDPSGNVTVHGDLPLKID